MSKAYWLALLLPLAGCSMFASARPTRPGYATITYTAKGGTVKIVNDENAQGPLVASVDCDGAVTIGTGGSRKFEMRQAMGQPLLWIGGLLVVAGVLMLVLDSFTAWLIPTKTALIVMAGGAGLCLLAFVGEGIREHFIFVTVIFLVPAAGFGVYEYLHHRHKADALPPPQGG